MHSDAEDFDERWVGAWVAALDALDAPLSDKEAVLLLNCFPLDGSTVSGLAWTLLHAIESAPHGQELLSALDDRSWWTTYLRRRAQRGGFL